MSDPKSKATAKIYKLNELENSLTVCGDKLQEKAERDIFDEDFIAMFQKDKKASLTAVLEYISGSAEVPSPKVYVAKEELNRHIKDLMKRRLADLIEKSLKNVSEEELQELAKFVEEQAGLGASKFDVSNKDRVHKLISCMQMAVPFYAGGARNIKFLEFVNRHSILLDFYKLPDERRLDFLRALAEISPHATAGVAAQMFPSTIELLKSNMPDKKIKDKDICMPQKMNYAYVECLQYMLHHFHKTRLGTRPLDNEDFMWRLKCVTHITWSRMKKLEQTFHELDKAVRETENYHKNYPYEMQRKFCVERRRENGKTEVRTCNNILAMTKGGKLCNVPLSWKAARNPSISVIYSGESMHLDPPDRHKLDNLSQDHMKELSRKGYCYPSNNEVQALVNLPSLRLQREGSFILNDFIGVAMLSWEIEVLEFLNLVNKGDSNKGISGKVRNQFYHLLCWAYVASDLVTGTRCLQNWERKFLPLCTWYLCAFAKPEKLGEDAGTKDWVDVKGQKHFCYGNSIGHALQHIQVHGIPREVMEDFMCTDHQPPSADEPDMQRRKIIKSRKINTLKDAMIELQNNPKQPIGADLILYSSMYKVRNEEIYYGPKSESAVFCGYHGVVIEEFREIDGKVVAVCKLSNGIHMGDYGYLYVSVTTQCIPVAVSKERQCQVRGSKEPSHLLTHFIIAEMDAKEIDKEEEKKDREEDKEEDDAKEDDSTEEDDYEDYVPLAKRPRPNSRPNSRPASRSRYMVFGLSDFVVDETIIATERVLAINILGRFLSNLDNNIRYVALNMLMKAITFDDQAVQKHIVAILECVKDSDASIRKRALELVFLLVNENNVKQVTKVLTDDLEIGDEDFKEDLSAKACSIVEKFSPEKIWYIDQMLKELSEAGKFVKDDVWHALIVIIRNASELHVYTVKALYKAVLTYSEQETLVRVVIWCIGEYGDLLSNNVGMLGIEDLITITECDAVDIIEDAITLHNSDMTTKAMALGALLKVSSRFPSISERIKDIVVKQKGSLLLEMQQSAIEFNSVVDRHKNIRYSLVEKTLVLDEATLDVRRDGSLSVDNQIMPDFEQVLHAKALSFIGDKSVNLSWKEATKQLPSTTTLGKRPANANGAGNNVGYKKGRVQSYQFVNKAF